MRSLSLFLLVVVICVTANVQAAFTEDFDAFADGVLTAQENWEAHSLITVVADGSGGKALKSTSYNDKTTRHDAAGVDFALTMDQDGIEYGFDIKEDVTTAFDMRMYLRVDETATYSPSFGFDGGKIVIFPAGESGDPNVGNAFYSDAIYGAGTEADPGYWLKGDWLRVKITLTGDAFDTATVKAYNLSRGGLEIPTGLKALTIGANVKYHGGWTRFNFRGGSTSTSIDNVYVTDYTAEEAGYVEDFEALTLGSINQAGWRSNAPAVTVVTTTNSGSYVGGQAMKSGSSVDEWPQYAEDRNEDFGFETAYFNNILQLGFYDGVEMGFDFMDSGTTVPYCNMHFRAAMTATYSPAFGFDGGYFAIRPAGEAGDTYKGTNLSSAVTAGLYESGDWVEVRMVMRGPNYNWGSLYAYNMTKGVDIPTGLVDLHLAALPQRNAAKWTRLVFRMITSATSHVDNAYISDYTNTSIVAEPLTPKDGAISVATSNVLLKWVSGSSIDSHLVWFGTSPSTLLLEKDTTISSCLLPYTLDYWTDYYWRVDEVIDGSVVSTGDVWSFKTMAEPVELPRTLAYEGFDYAQYIALKAGGNGYGGTGWATGWEREVGEYCYVEVGSGSLDPGMDYPYGTTGNKIQHSNGASANDAMRKLEYPIDLRVDQDYYISYLAMGDSDTFNAVNFKLRESKSGGASFGVDMFYTGYPNVTTPKFYLRDFGGVWHTNPVAGWSSGVVSLVIIKIEASTADSDVVSVCVYNASNPMPEVEPATWQRTTSADKNTIYEWIQLSGRSDAYDMWHVDEIHIGTGWGAVTGWVEACGDLGTIMDWDLNADCTIDLGDFAVIAGQWLNCTDPAGTGCVWALDADDVRLTDLFTDISASQRNVYEVGSAVVVNGDVSEWEGAVWYNTRFNTGYNTGNAADVTEARMAINWDPTTPEVVYVAVKVTDTDQTLSDSPTAWDSGDNLEVGFSVNETSTDELWFTSQTYDTAQYYQIFSKASGGAWCTLGSISHATDDPATGDIDVAYATSVEGDVIIYEMALPTYSAFNLGTGTGTKLTLSDGDVIAFNLQINSVSAAGTGGLYKTQTHKPAEWSGFRVTANSSLVLGDMGYLDVDLDEDGEVGLTDLMTIAHTKWLSCTDPEIPGCDTPWAP